MGDWIRNATSNMYIGVTGGNTAVDNAKLQVVKCGDTSLSAQRRTVSQIVKPRAGPPERTRSRPR